jgi:hypothetical protein
MNFPDRSFFWSADGEPMELLWRVHRFLLGFAARLTPGLARGFLSEAYGHMSLDAFPEVSQII